MRNLYLKIEVNDTVYNGTIVWWWKAMGEKRVKRSVNVIKVLQMHV
jgi:hypothetical protein